MSEINWTPGQLSAITETSSRLLVSAAAGSGKTTVLTERLVRRLTDEVDPYDLSELLIVTFTKAASADLKEQISTALNKALAQNPSSKHLSRQLALLPSARISTIHAFCFGLIRLHFQKLALPSSLRIADENEGRLLAVEIMDQLLEDLYEADPCGPVIPDFPLLIDTFVTIDDASLCELLLGLYNRLQSIPRGIEGLVKNASDYEACLNEAFDTTLWGKVFLSEITDAASYFMPILQSAVSYFSADETAEKKYADAFGVDLALCEQICALAKENHGEQILSCAKNYRPSAIRSTRYPDPPQIISDAVSAHNQLKSFFEFYAKKPCFPASEDIQAAADSHARILHALSAILLEFDNRFGQEKLRRGILDYNDLERYAHMLLVDANDKPTALACDMSRRFREIYIDEYQDVNEIQDAIFTALSVNCSRFMVGDIKQSIYAFRGSAPHLFAAYRRNEAFKTVFLAENFRSSKPIIDFGNAVFDVLFRHCGPDMPYEPEDSLVCGKSLPADRLYPVSLTILENPSSASSKEEDTDPEPRYVASCIQDLIKNKGYTPNDIVILLRSPSSRAADYENALAQLSIASLNQEKKSLLENEEILLLLSLLRVIDNPRRDIDLAAVLRSPLFGFTMDDLITIRKSGEGCLFEALVSFTKLRDFEKGNFFLSKLEQYRHMAIATAVDRLILDLIEDTSISAFPLTDLEVNETANRANLLMFYDHARRFESGSYKGLSNFLKYIDGILNSDHASFPSPEKNVDASSVRIMSIHASKGLQFPVCFLCGVGHSINDRDSSGNLLLDPALGISLKLTDESGFVRYDTPFRLAASRSIHNRTVFEEMRILYVALTRAKERLIITGSASDPRSLIAETACAARHLHPGTLFPLVNGSTSYLRMMLIALQASDFSDYRLELPAPDLQTPANENETLPFDNTPVSHVAESIDPSIKSKIEAYYAFRYPGAHLSGIPAKLSVSRLPYEPLNEGELELALTTSAVPALKKPRFLDAAAATAAERGTATHEFMQFCDFSRLSSHSTVEECERLVNERFLAPGASTLIDHLALSKFFTSELYEEMKNAANLRREIRFNVCFPSSFFLTDTEPNDVSFLVQGIIDCYYITPQGECVLLDYKTDHIPYEMQGDLERENNFLAERHFSQLRYYRYALEKMLCRSVDRVLLWSFSLGRVIDLTPFFCDGEE